MGNIICRDESYQLLGILFGVHNELGGGFLEAVYSDAVEYELKQRDIQFQREKKYQVNYNYTSPSFLCRFCML